MKMNEMEMNLEEMEMVSGGTVNELSELLQTIGENGALGAFLKVHGHTPVLNILDKTPVTELLYDLGVDADISVGFLGTGIGSDPNKYVSLKTNKALSHQQVIQILKSAS